MLISVVIPLYNKENCIAKTLNSALEQNFRDYEIIVVNDGSQDDSEKRVRAFHDSRLRLVSQPNQGVSAARNTGILAARGEYIAFLDADDVWDPEYLSQMSSLIRNYPQSDIFVSAYKIDFGTKSRLSHQMAKQEGCLESYWAVLGTAYDFVWTSAAVLRKQALVNSGLFRVGEWIGQDLDMWARVAQNNPHVAYTSRPLVTYNRNAESNARMRIKIANPQAFMRILKKELENPARTREEKKAIASKLHKKKTAYVYTCILAGERGKARKELKIWSQIPSSRMIKAVRLMLLTASCLPMELLNYVYAIRLKVF